MYYVMISSMYTTPTPHHYTMGTRDPCNGRYSTMVWYGMVLGCSDRVILRMGYRGITW